MSVFRTTVRITYDHGPTGVVTVRIVRRKPDGMRPVASGFKCDVALVPELIRELEWALQIAKDEALTVPKVRDFSKAGRRS
jgi:hypothetical protein